jgi:hypothetical protein
MVATGAEAYGVSEHDVSHNVDKIVIDRSRTVGIILHILSERVTFRPLLEGRRLN